MKKRLGIIAAFVVLLICIVAAIFLFNKPQSARIIVATDTHYLSSQINDGGQAFATMINNSDGKMVQYCDEIFSAFSEDVIAQKPDVLILSGDLTFNGEKASHEDFVKKLEYIQKSGVQVLVIPGNHDINSQNAVGFNGDEYYSTQSIDADEFKQMYYDFGMAQAVSVDENSLSYMYKINNDLYALMLDTNAFGQNFVQDASYAWIESQLQMASDKNAQVITVSHQNLFAHNEFLSFGYQLYDANELLEMLNKYNVKCHLSGHIHMQHIMEDGVCEIATSSLLVAPIQYGVIEFDGDFSYNTKSVDVSTWARNNNIENDELLNFDSFKTEFFEASGSSRALARLDDSNLTQEDKELLATTFAKLNSSYFAGSTVDVSELEAGIELWQEQDDFTKNYIQTMADEADNDYTSINIK